MDRLSAAAMALVLGSVGCATSYTPRPGPRLAMILDEGKPTYVRDGRKYEAGMFAGGLVDAVHGVPEAEEHARTSHTESTVGFGLVLLGGLTTGAGLGVSFSANNNSTQQAAGLGILAAALVIDCIGAGLSASAGTHQLDAMNIFNDSVEAPHISPATLPADQPPTVPPPVPPITYPVQPPTQP